MTVYSVKTGNESIGLLAGNAASISDFESISSITVGSSGSSIISFTNIPSTYAHLQIRAMSRKSSAGGGDGIFIRFNSDTSTNYSVHDLTGNGSSASAYGAGSTGQMNPTCTATSVESANVFGVQIWDILDYANTNKYKTLRAMNGYDNNTSGKVRYGSGLWRSTSVITEINITGNTDNFSQYTNFCLYGIKAV